MNITLGFTDLGLYCHLIKVLKIFCAYFAEPFRNNFKLPGGKNKTCRKTTIHSFFLSDESPVNTLNLW